MAVAKVYEKIGKWESARKSIYYFPLAGGVIGPFARCTADEDDHLACKVITVADVLPYAELNDGVRCLVVPSLAGQLFLRSYEDATADTLAKAINALKLDSLAIPSMDPIILLAECQRRLLNCSHARQLVKECLDRHMPIRAIGDFAKIVGTKLSGEMVDHGEGFNDQLGVAWEKAYVKAANLIDKEIMDGNFFVFTPETLDLTRVGSIKAGLVLQKFPTLPALVQKFRRSLFLGSAQAAILFLPQIDGTSLPLLQKLAELMENFTHVTFYVVPPPPMLCANYDRVIDFLTSADRPTVKTNLHYRGRTLFSHGWIGGSVNNFHVKNGEWTRNGLIGIQRFLVDCLQLTWSFFSPTLDDPTSQGTKPGRELPTETGLSPGHRPGVEPRDNQPSRCSSRSEHSRKPSSSTSSSTDRTHGRRSSESALVVRVDSTRPPPVAEGRRRPLTERVTLTDSRPGSEEKRRRSHR